MNSLYVCLFSNGCVKLGRSKNSVRRIAQHAEQLACHRIELVDSAVFECAGVMQVAEARALRECRRIAAEVRGNEWFYGIAFDVACRIAHESAEALDCGDDLDSGAPALQRAIDLMGGITNLANSIGGTTKAQTIANWLKRGVPVERCVTIAKLTGVRCQDLRPDFNWARIIEVLGRPGRYSEQSMAVQ